MLTFIVLARSAPGQCGAANLGSIDTPGQAYGVAVSGTLAYLTDGFATSCVLQIIDVANPSNPAIVGTLEAPSAAQGVAISGTVAYVANGSLGLLVADVSDPASPGILGSIDTPAIAYGVAVSGTLAYVADGLSGLQVIDVSDLENPALLGWINTPGLAVGVTVSGRLAYVADSSAGLQVVDVSDPANPAIACSATTTSQARGVAFSGAVAYVANDLAGLQVVGVTPGIFGACCINATCLEVMTEANCLIVGGEYVDDGDCAACIEPLVNDDCADALPIAAGDTLFTTIGATTDGPPLPMSYDEDSNLTFVNDVWFVHVPASSGTLTVTTCGQASFDTRLAAYTGACGALDLLACNDDGPGCSKFTSVMEVPVTTGMPVLLRVGGLGETGTGTLTLTLEACVSDLDGNGVVGFSDLTRILSDWGACN